MWGDRRYWAKHPAYPGSRWNFVDKDTGMVLYRIGHTRIQRHVLIQGDASPDNPELKEDFEQRNRRLYLKLIPLPNSLNFCM